MTEFHFATVWEALADRFADQTVLRHGDKSRSWRDYDERAARIATALDKAGLKPDSKFGLYLYNSPEYLEAQFGGFKMRGVPVNVNYRYTEDELVYLLDNSDSEALFFHAGFADRVAAIKDKLPNIKLFIEVDDDSGQHFDDAVKFEDLIVAHEPMPRIDRPASDIYMLYTGGTTGMPKGVMYTVGTLTEGFMLGYDFRGFPRPETVDQVVEACVKVHEAGAKPVSLVCCPLMHGTGMWVGAMIPMMLGGTIITMPNVHFDADLVWQNVEKHKATDVTIVGDAFAKPMLQALDAAQENGSPYDISSVGLIISSGVMWTAPVKEGLLKHGDMMLADMMGSTEGTMGQQITSRELPAKTAKFELGENVKVFTEDGKEVKPGSGEIGMIATAGNVPVGYYKDPEKSAKTFREVDGVRYSFPGDFAQVEADGTITLLGRGSVCINTAGEKVFPEEVEEAIKSHPGIYDCLVVGLPDDRFGERVTAVVSPRDGQSVDAEPLIEHTRTKLAGYKLPKSIIPVETVKRAPNGKADYKWAKRTAADALGITLPN